MVMEDRLRPYGLKAKDLPEREGFDVDDNWLRTREETDARKSSSAATGSAATRACGNAWTRTRRAGTTPPTGRSSPSSRSRS
jgi:hypothetical protein